MASANKLQKELEKSEKKEMTCVTQNEKKLLKRLLKGGGATLVVDNGGEVKITVFYNTERLRSCGLRHD